MPRFHAEPEFDGTNSQTFIVIDFGKRLVLIGGSEYGGEIKKSIFTAMNYYHAETRRVTHALQRQLRHR